MINWNVLLNNQNVNSSIVNFVTGNITLEELNSNSEEVSQELQKLKRRSNGEAIRLAVKSLRRRGFNVEPKNQRRYMTYNIQ